MNDPNTKSPPCSHSHCLFSRIAEGWVTGEEALIDQLFSCEPCLSQYMSLEETLSQSLVWNLTHAEPEGSHSFEFQQDIDTAKADLLLSNSKSQQALPLYLKNYVQTRLSEDREEENTIIVRLQKNGLRFIDSLLDPTRFEALFLPLPSMRGGISSLETPSAEKGYLVFEEKVQDDQRYTYQIVQETPEEVYLSIRIHSSNPNSFAQVNLKKDGRFILSSKLNEEGLVSFSRLKAGLYTVEFQGENLTKTVDLRILVD